MFISLLAYSELTKSKRVIFIVGAHTSTLQLGQFRMHFKSKEISTLMNQLDMFAHSHTGNMHIHKDSLLMPLIIFWLLNETQMPSGSPLYVVPY
jgi:hypothetical protein